MKTSVPIAVCLANVWFYPAFLAVSAGMFPVFLVSVAMAHAAGGRRRAVCCVRRMIGVYGRAVLAALRPVARIRLQGPGWDARDAGGRIYVCNHRSASDPFLMARLPRGEIVQIVNKWPFRLPVLGRVARLAGYISIREMTPERFYETASRYLAEGLHVAAFPEGTRSGDRHVGPFHSAVFRLALRTGVPVVPIAIAGNERTPPRGSLILRPARIVMSMLPPLRTDTYGTMTPFQFKNHVRGLIAAELLRIESAA